MNWISVDDKLPEDGQKCLVVFEMYHSKDDAQRFIEIDEFNDGVFDSIANYTDQASCVGLPAGSIISKLRAVCWTPTELSNAPVTFDMFWKEEKEEG